MSGVVRTSNGDEAVTFRRPTVVPNVRPMSTEAARVAAETESYAEMTNGRVYNNLYHFVFELSDGRIRRVKEYLDTEHTRAVFLG
jgi:uncharacterized protein